MFKRTVAAIAAFALTAPAAFAAPVSPAKRDVHPEDASVSTPAWVVRSNAYAQVLLKTLAEFNPEFASRFGLPGYDDKVIDMKPDVEQRTLAALTQARATLQKDLAG